MCHRFPKAEGKRLDDWCGEWRAREEPTLGAWSILTHERNAARQEAEQLRAENEQLRKNLDAAHRQTEMWREFRQDDVHQLREENERLRENAGVVFVDGGHAMTAKMVEGVLRENERLSEDAALLDWLEKHGRSLIRFVENRGWRVMGFINWENTPRDAIRAAKAAREPRA